MRTISTTYETVKASVDYTCNCTQCGKELHRKAVVEHTLNPFNVNPSGEQKTRREVYDSALAEAKTKAMASAIRGLTCRDCEEAPMRALLLEMATSPDTTFPSPSPYWNSPMHYLADRKHVEAVHTPCTCGAPCCSGYINENGYRITKTGMARAAKLGVSVE